MKKEVKPVEPIVAEVVEGVHFDKDLLKHSLEAEAYIKKVIAGVEVKIKKRLNSGEVSVLAKNYFDIYFNGFIITETDKDGIKTSDILKDEIGKNGFSPISAEEIIKHMVVSMCTDINNLDEVYIDLCAVGAVDEIIDCVENYYTVIRLSKELIQTELSFEVTARNLADKLLSMIPDDKNIAHILEIAPELINKIDPKRWKVIMDALPKTK